jgi:hypothetical protein
VQTTTDTVTVQDTGRGYTVQVGAYTVGEASRSALAAEIADLLRSDAELRSVAFRDAALAELRRLDREIFASLQV